LCFSTVPEQPTNLQGEATSPNMIQLVWDAPEDSGNNIRSYELYFNSSHERKPKHVSIVPPRTRYTMEDLTPNTVYHILIAAKSSRGEGASTPIIQVRTLEYSKCGTSCIDMCNYTRFFLYITYMRSWFAILTFYIFALFLSFSLAKQRFLFTHLIYPVYCQVACCCEVSSSCSLCLVWCQC